MDSNQGPLCYLHVADRPLATPTPPGCFRPISGIGPLCDRAPPRLGAMAAFWMFRFGAEYSSLSLSRRCGSE
jgi:hypothetical protein